jgi:hypothetical protein
MVIMSRLVRGQSLPNQHRVVEEDEPDMAGGLAADGLDKQPLCYTMQHRGRVGKQKRLDVCFNTLVFDEK